MGINFLSNAVFGLDQFLLRNPIVLGTYLFSRATPRYCRIQQGGGRPGHAPQSPEMGAIMSFAPPQ